jgi:hypothetical protein
MDTQMSIAHQQHLESKIQQQQHVDELKIKNKLNKKTPTTLSRSMLASFGRIAPAFNLIHSSRFSLLLPILETVYLLFFMPCCVYIQFQAGNRHLL